MPVTLKKHDLLLVLFTSISLLSGCATMSSSDCQHADWHAKGEADGARGALPDHLIKHKSACAKVGVTPNKTLWEQGRQTGLKNYCTESNIYQIGREGYSFSPVCGFIGRTELGRLEERYEEGRRRYRLEKQMDDLHRDMYDRDGTPWYRPLRRWHH